MHWGTITWYTFHSLAEKINDEKILIELYGQIRSLCNNLPCPYCIQHATKFLSYHRDVHSKEHLKEILFKLHNEVNKRTKKTQYERKDLIKYEKANIHLILRQFFNIWNQYLRSGNAMLYSFHRKKCIKLFHTFIINNIKYFS